MKQSPPVRVVSAVWLFLVLSFLVSTPLAAGRRPLSYDIKVELRPDTAMLQARETITWTNTSGDYVPDLQFHLYWNAFKNELSTLAREARREKLFSRYRVRKDEWGWVKITSLATAAGTDLMPAASFISPDEPVNPDDQTVLRVELPEPLAPGQTITLHLEFQAKVPRNGLRTGYYKDGFFISQWFPKLGVYEEGRGWNCHQYHLNSEFYADFADYRVEITVPARMVVGACGEEVSRVEDPAGGRTTYTYVQQNIHDFAWTASPRFLKLERWFRGEEEVTAEEYRKIAELLGLAPEEVRLPDVRMILLIEKQHQKQADRHFRALKAALKYYGLWYGPYPYRTITMVDPPFRTGSGGMEYPTLFTAGTSVILEKDVLSPEGVIIHEFGHGYWYGLVANNEFEEAWLDEGINTYSTGKVSEVAYGPGRLPFRFNGLPLSWLIRFPAVCDWQLGRVTSGPVSTLDPIATESWKFYNSMSYSLNVYYRAATCLHTLERYLGEKTWARIMRTYHQRYRFLHPRTQDFIRVVKEVSGQDLTWFFDEFFFQAKDFDYAIGSVETAVKPEKYRGLFDGLPTSNPGQAGARAKKPYGKQQKLYQTTITLRRLGEARLGPGLKLKLRVEFEDGSVEWREWDGQGRWTRFNFETPTLVRTAVLDPDGIWLVDTNLANNSYSRKGPGARLLSKTSGLLWLTQEFLLTLSGCL
ncbi:MAG: M1 family metallopeptidase [Candidatus Saccharicenans sp.]|uniref:M1 family metallopeptidase n=1 Tax=Candidatus Saccharicenans sp. TaxID=2819258 RepID=UPI00404A2233